MKIFQFAFTDPDDNFLPHNYPVNVSPIPARTTTTQPGWYDLAPENEKDFCRRYLARPGDDIAWSMIRTLWRSVAAWVIAPMQDFSAWEIGLV